ncbi:MAG: hypothetical protein HY291_08050 [Planctomycetes bacterium]|nr:hypothetical protein [Planctomycetota bacterium]
MSEPDSTKQLPALEPRSEGSGLVLGLLLFLSGPLLVAGALNHPFLSFNGVEEFSANVAQGVAAGSAESSAPLGALLVRLEFAVAGNSPAFFRLVNLAYLFAAAMLLFNALKALMPVSGEYIVGPGFSVVPSRNPTKAHVAAGLAAAWFFFHPTNVETAAWASRGANAQALFFCMLAWWAAMKPLAGASYQAFLEPPSTGRFALAAAALAAGVASHPSALGFVPLLMLLELAWVKGPLSGRLIRTGFFGAAGLLAGSKALAAGPAIADFPNAITFLTAMGRAFAVIVAPWPLSFVHEIEPAANLAAPGVLAALALLAVVALALLWTPVDHRRFWVLLAGLGCLLGSGIAYGSGPGLFQEHAVCLALPAAAALLALAIEALQYRALYLAEASQTGARKLAFGAAVLGCAALAGLAFLRSAVFADSLSLMTDAAERQPGSYFAQAGLAQELLGRGEALRARAPEEAQTALLGALDHAKLARECSDRILAPNAAAVRYVEARAAFLLDRADAREKARFIVSLEGPGLEAEQAGALWILASFSLRDFEAARDTAHLEDARADLTRLLALKQDDARARFALAGVLESLGAKPDAAAEFRILANHPQFGEASRAALARLDPSSVAAAKPPVPAPAAPEQPPADPKELPKPAQPIKPNEAKVALVIMLRENDGKLKDVGLPSLLNGDLTEEKNGSFAFGTWKCNPSDATFSAEFAGALKVNGVFRKRNDRLRAFILEEHSE